MSKQEVVIPESISRLLDPNVVRFSPSLQGSRYMVEEGLPVQGIELGLVAGPSRSLTNGLHELAHFIEIDDRRCFVSNWGLEGGKLDLGEGYTAFGTAKHVQREMRVWAIEYHLRQLAGCPATIEEITSACIYLTDIEYVIPLNCEHREQDQKVREHVAKGVQALVETYTLENILAELERKQKLSGRSGRS